MTLDDVISTLGKQDMLTKNDQGQFELIMTVDGEKPSTATHHNNIPAGLVTPIPSFKRLRAKQEFLTWVPYWNLEPFPSLPLSFFVSLALGYWFILSPSHTYIHFFFTVCFILLYLVSYLARILHWNIHTSYFLLIYMTNKKYIDPIWWFWFPARSISQNTPSLHI